MAGHFHDESVLKEDESACTTRSFAEVLWFASYRLRIARSAIARAPQQVRRKSRGCLFAPFSRRHIFDGSFRRARRRCWPPERSAGGCVGQGRMEVEPADDWPQSMTRRPWSSASETAFVWGTDHGGAAEATMRDNVDREVPADVSDSLRSYRGIEQLAGGEDIVMQDAFDLGPRIDAEWQAAKVFVIDTNVLISNLSLLEYTAHLLADARRENIPGSRNCCLVIPKMVRVECVQFSIR